MNFISHIHSSLANGFGYITRHPQFIFTLVLIILIPLAFIISGQQFLNASQDNLERLEKDRIGLLHDSFLSLIAVTHADPALLQVEIERVASLNPDIVVFQIVQKTDEGYIPIVALDVAQIGVPERSDVPYSYAYTRPDDSLVDSVEYGSVRYLRGVRLANTDEEPLVILTVTSREQVDALFQERIRKAYLWLAIILAVILFLLVRHMRLIDYGHLYRESKRANEMKDLFTNMIAHELRAPLTAMRGYASMIKEVQNAPEGVVQYGTRIEEAAKRLLLIINDLLDVARIQSGKLSITKAKTDIAPIVISVGDALLATAREKGLGLNYRELPRTLNIQTDEKRFHQVLTNVLSNAIKYTHTGTITISIEDRHDRVELRVKDTGMGISADDQKKLFAPFFRVATKDVSAITGTGLGMWITKQLVELLGGSIGVESIKGVGTHIVLTFPK